MLPREDPRVGKNLTWAYEGQLVWVPFTDTQYLVCKVILSAGNHIKVNNPPRNFTTWREVAECYEYVKVTK